MTENYIVDIDTKGNKHYLNPVYIVELVQKKDYCLVITVAGKWRSRSTADHIREVIDSY
ncbi:hypothetical protein [Flavobacterium sp. AG291]|uniref:hypothetical protein n=1 Tax=Flavobacterium sp. AG291 TaxID=2184000 RepID=UPI000E2D1F73|nr:hypothetical protein [Flavobacterium sp. AG291]RDI07053.1 hypothetical protein DEU42_113153 [Flavobacterium sp. AG291]